MTVDTISKALGTTYVVDLDDDDSSKELAVIADSPDEREDTSTDEKNDYELVRNTLRFVIKNSAKALKSISDIADQKQEHEPFDSVARLTKAVVDSTRELKELHRNSNPKNKEKVEQVTNHQVIDKAVFVGTPEDLFKRTIK